MSNYMKSGFYDYLHIHIHQHFPCKSPGPKKQHQHSSSISETICNGMRSSHPEDHLQIRRLLPKGVLKSQNYGNRIPVCAIQQNMGWSDSVLRILNQTYIKCIYTFEWCMIMKIKQQNHTKIQSKSIPPSVSYIPTAHPRHCFPPSSLGSPKSGLVFEVVRRNYQSRNASVTPPTASVRPPSKRRPEKGGRLFVAEMMQNFARVFCCGWTTAWTEE